MSTVLVVDDSRSIRQLVSFTLNQFKHQVIEAVDGQKAMDVAAKNSIDLVITDKNMPEMDGIELTKALRKQEQTKHTPILMLTSGSNPKEMDEGKVAGVTGWLVKPFNPTTLMSVVDKVLS